MRLGMSIRFLCPSCDSRLKAPDTAAGKRAKCKCGKGFVVPSSDRGANLAANASVSEEEILNELLGPPEERQRQREAEQRKREAEQRQRESEEFWQREAEQRRRKEEENQRWREAELERREAIRQQQESKFDKVLEQKALLKDFYFQATASSDMRLFLYGLERLVVATQACPGGFGTISDADGDALFSRVLVIVGATTWDTNAILQVWREIKSARDRAFRRLGM